MELVERIRSFLPDVCLSTDMITGFCGETEEDHKDSLSLIEIVKYHYAFLFKYSMRKVWFENYYFQKDTAQVYCNPLDGKIGALCWFMVRHRGSVRVHLSRQIKTLLRYS